MPDREKVIKEWETVLSRDPLDAPWDLIDDTLALLKEQKKIKEQFIEAFNTIRDAYNAPANREKILLNYLARNACCCERKTTD